MSGMRFPRRAAAVLASTLLLSGAVAGGAPGERTAGRDLVPADARAPGVLVGGDAGAAKAQVDTIYLIGGPGQLSGKFEQANHTVPDPQGWIGVDLTAQVAAPRWQIDPFNAANLDPGRPGNHAMWCGQTFAAGCGGADPPQGYDNNYDEWLDWRAAVANNTVATTVRVTAILNSDTEPGYDFLSFAVETATGMSLVGTAYSGVRTGVAFDRTFSVGPADYVGAGHDEIHLRWQATSDDAYSDGDCLWPTAGHSQIDNVRVYCDGALKTFDDFDTVTPANWVVAFRPGVGNFAKVWPRLLDVDPCHEDVSPQWAFIDDGVVVPGTGGTLGVTWTYGPGGYVVNMLGGLAGPEFLLDNQIWSPPLAWPAGCEAGQLLWNEYEHLPFENGLFTVWSVRNSTDGGATWSTWRNDNFIYWVGGANYIRRSVDLLTYLEPGCNRVQVALGLLQIPIGYWEYPDGTPAPYFDNVTLTAFPIGGPAITAREIDLFNDGWPAAAAIDYANLANNSVRLDMARNIAARATLRNDPGDSIVMTIAPGRAGAVLDGRPEMFVRMRANPLFDGVRALPAGFGRTGNVISGVVPGDTVRANGVVQTNRWSWDLPDEGFFFPGDELHYFIRARDNLAGNIGTSYLPADTTGFTPFPGDPGYGSQRLSQVFRTDALPTLFSATPGDQPRLLFWNDARDRSNQDEWFTALDNLGYRLGLDYDMYCTNGPSSGVGNGLGGRTNAAKLAGYSTLLYCSSNLSTYTLSNGDFNGDPGNDIAVVDAWLSLGGRNMFATGDNIVQDLSNSGATATAFRDKWFSAIYSGSDIHLLIGGQYSPVVSPLAVAGAPVISGRYVAFGGCQGGLNDFDAVTAVGAAVSIAEFTSPTGATGAYPYAAAVYNNVAASTARVVLLPYDLQYIYDIGPRPGGRPIRADILQDVLGFFGTLPGGPAVAVPEPATLSVRGYPNPFNPAVRIAYSLPARGPLSLKLYDVRGRLVRVLHDGIAEAGPGAATWDGRDAAGNAAASGLYFCEARGGGRTIVEKLTLVR